MATYNIMTHLSEEQIRSHINCKKELNFLLYDSVSSTNDVIKKHLDSQEGLIVIAEHQSEGRGRLGRVFHSPQNGIYMSMLLKPTLKGDEISVITLAAAVALCRTIEQLTDKKPGIKWVNDIFIDGKKVSGILTLSSINRDGSANYAILGMGINLFTPKGGFDSEIKTIAGAVFDMPDDDLYAVFSAALIDNFFSIYPDRLDEVSREYRERSIVLGRDITVNEGEMVYNAHVVDMDERCNLMLRLENGESKRLFFGDVSIKL